MKENIITMEMNEYLSLNKSQWFSKIIVICIQKALILQMENKSKSVALIMINWKY